MNLPIERIHECFSPWQGSAVPGCALGIFRDGEVVFEQGFGMASLEYDVAIGPQTVFRVASTSKQFTAACLLALCRKGALDLNGDLRDHLPRMPRYHDPVLLHHLLRHTSGIRDYIALIHLPGMDSREWDSEERVLELLSRQRELNFRPGERFMYSNSGYFLLALVMERATNLSLRELAENLLFAPLGMTATHFHDDHREVVRHRAQGYSPLEEGGFELDMTVSEIVGDGGAFTTITDMFRWYLALRNDQINGGKGFTREMITPGRLNSGKSILYAAGLFSSMYRKERLISHPGAFAGFRSEMLWFPEADFCVVCLANRADLPAALLARRVADLCLKDRLTGPDSAAVLVKKPFADFAVPSVSERTGVFRNLVTGNIWELTAEDGRLKAEEAGGDTHNLIPAGPGRFVGLDAPVELEFRFDDRKESLQLTVRAEVEEPYPLEEIVPATPASDRLAQCAGIYRCDELDLTWELTVREGRLHLDVPGEGEAPLRPLVKELFRLDDMTLGFHRDETGRVASLMVSTARVHGLRFRRSG